MERTDRLKRLLEHGNTTQHDLAQAAGVTDGYVSQIMTGRKPPTSRILLAAETLGMQALADSLRDQADVLAAYARIRKAELQNEEEVGDETSEVVGRARHQISELERAGDGSTAKTRR